MKYLIDSSAWIEYLEGSEKGEKVARILEEENEIFVLPLNIGEVISKVKRKKGNIETAYHALITHAKIIEATPKQAKEAGLLHAQKKQVNSSFSLADGFMLVVAQSIHANLITKDPHFKDVAYVTII